MTILGGACFGVYVLCEYFIKDDPSATEMVGFIVLSYVIGFILCMFLDMVWTSIIQRVLNLELMPPIDLAFILQEDPKN